MAIRLDKVFGGGAETRLRRQLAFNLNPARAMAYRLRVTPLDRRASLAPLTVDYSGGSRTRGPASLDG